MLAGGGNHEGLAGLQLELTANIGILAILGRKGRQRRELVGHGVVERMERADHGLGGRGDGAVRVRVGGEAVGRDEALRIQIAQVLQGGLELLVDALVDHLAVFHRHHVFIGHVDAKAGVQIILAVHPLVHPEEVRNDVFRNGAVPAAALMARSTSVYSSMVVGYARFSSLSQASLMHH